MTIDDKKIKKQLSMNQKWGCPIPSHVDFISSARQIRVKFLFDGQHSNASCVRGRDPGHHFATAEIIAGLAFQRQPRALAINSVKLDKPNPSLSHAHKIAYILLILVVFFRTTSDSSSAITIF